MLARRWNRNTPNSQSQSPRTACCCRLEHSTCYLIASRKCPAPLSDFRNAIFVEAPQLHHVVHLPQHCHLVFRYQQPLLIVLSKICYSKNSVKSKIIIKANAQTFLFSPAGTSCVTLSVEPSLNHTMTFLSW